MGRRYLVVALAQLAQVIPAQGAQGPLSPVVICAAIGAGQPVVTYTPVGSIDATPLRLRAAWHDVRIDCLGWHTIECTSDWFEPVLVVAEGEGEVPAKASSGQVHRIREEAIGGGARVRARIWVDGTMPLTILVGAQQPSVGAYELRVHHELLARVTNQMQLDDVRRAFDARITSLAPEDPAILRAAKDYVWQLSQRGMRAKREEVVEMVLFRCPPERCVDPEVATHFLEACGVHCMFENPIVGVGLLDRAISIASMQPYPDQTRLGMLRRNRGLLFFSVDIDRAIEECRTALTMLRNAPGPAAAETLGTTHQLAALLEIQRDWSTAADLCRRALDESRSAAGVDGERGDLEAVLAFALAETGSWPEALDALARLWSGNPTRSARTTDARLLHAIAKCVTRDPAADKQLSAATRWLEERGLLSDPAAQMRAAGVVNEAGDAAEAERLYSLVAVGGDESAAASAMLWLGARAVARGDVSAAAAAFARSSVLAEGCGSVFPEALESWSQLVQAQGDHAEATRLMRKALAQHRQIDAVDGESCGRAALRLACLLFAGGAREEGLATFRQAIEALELHPAAKATRGLLEHIDGMRDRLAFAVMAEALLEAHYDGMPTRARPLAATLRDAALVHAFSGSDSARVVPLLRARLAVMEAALPEFAATELDLARCYVVLADMVFGGVPGPWPIARERTRKLPTAARDVVDAALVAFTCLLVGEAAVALAEFERVDAMLGAEGSEGLAVGLAIPLLQIQGKFEAIELLVEGLLAEPLAAGAGPEALFERAELLRALAEAKMWRSDLATADRCLGDALALLESTLGEGSADGESREALRSLRVALAAIRVGQQRFDDAAALLDALPVRPDQVAAEAGSQMLRVAAQVEEAQLRAAIAAARGDLDAARRGLTAAIEQSRPLADLADVTAGMPQEQLAHLQADIGDSAAWASFMGLARAAHARLQRHMQVATEAECFDLVEKNRSSLESLIALARRLPANETQVDDAYRSLLAWKGCVFRSIGGRRRGETRDASPAGSSLLDLIRARASSSGGDRSGVADAESSVFDLAQRQRLERLIASAAKADAATIDFPALDAIAQVLPPGSVSIDMFLYEDWQWGRDEAGRMPACRRSAGKRLGAWCMRPGDPHAVAVDLGPAESLRQTVQDYLDAVVPQRGRDPEADTRVATAAEAIRLRLWAPLASIVGAAETVFVSPDGFLAEVPFEILQDQDGRFLIEKHAFVYTQDVLSLLAVLRAPAGVVVPSLLAVGAVDYDAEQAPMMVPIAAAPLRSDAAEPWIPLSETRREVDAIERMHARVFGVTAQRLTLRDDAASEERLKQALPAFGILHLATHGYFDRGRLHDRIATIRRQSRQRSAGGMLALESGALATALAGQLSGLVCAGANQPPAEGRDDGLLTTQEVQWLNLEACDLAVLSACQTGLGHAHGGEGLLSLRRAFHSAGARTVVSSLWRVRDDATKELMAAFYTNLWQRGLGRLAALRAAQLEMLAKNRARYTDPMPSTWGAFVLSGDWR